MVKKLDKFRKIAFSNNQYYHYRDNNNKAFDLVPQYLYNVYK